MKQEDKNQMLIDLRRMNVIVSGWFRVAHIQLKFIYHLVQSAPVLSCRTYYSYRMPTVTGLLFTGTPANCNFVFCTVFTSSYKSSVCEL
jgi:hypothetical protein